MDRKGKKQEKAYLTKHTDQFVSLLRNIYSYGCIANFYSFYSSVIRISFFQWIFFLRLIKLEFF